MMPCFAPNRNFYKDGDNSKLYVIYMERAMAPHSSTLAWKVPWTEEPGGL